MKQAHACHQAFPHRARLGLAVQSSTPEELKAPTLEAQMLGRGCSWPRSLARPAELPLRALTLLVLVVQSSSRCGTPDELKALIDEVHRLGMVVLMDIVHSHAITALTLLRLVCRAAADAGRQTSSRR